MKTLFRFLLILFFFLPPFITEGKEYTIVIDPGHGGKDIGAPGQQVNEKDINLGVARKLRDLIRENMPDAKVLMTRGSDFFVTLQGRSEFANRNQADIFISIHANSVDRKSPNANTVNGAAVYTLGLDRSDTNLNVAMRENAVMKLEPDYSTTYQGFDPSSAESYIAFEMMQHSNLDQSIALAEAVQKQLVSTAGRKDNGVRQAPFWVLVRTGMPAILVELDFICNPSMEKYMASESGQNQLAQAIFNGVAQFRKREPINTSATTKKQTTSTAKSETKPASPKADKSSEKSVTTNQTSTTDSNTKTTKDSAAKTTVTKKQETTDKTSETKKQETKPAETPKQTSTTQEPAQTKNQEVKNPAAGEIVYKIQIIAASKPLPENDSRFKGLSPVDSYTADGLTKYTYGNYSTREEATKALPSVKAKFHDAFIIQMRDGVRIK